MQMYPQRPQRRLSPAAVAEFRAAFGDRFSTSAAVREQHGRDESPYPACLPDAVVYAQGTEDVVRAVCLCRQ